MSLHVLLCLLIWDWDTVQSFDVLHSNHTHPQACPRSWEDNYTVHDKVCIHTSIQLPCHVHVHVRRLSLVPRRSREERRELKCLLLTQSVWERGYSLSSPPPPSLPQVPGIKAIHAQIECTLVLIFTLTFMSRLNGVSFRGP